MNLYNKLIISLIFIFAVAAPVFFDYSYLGVTSINHFSGLYTKDMVNNFIFFLIVIICGLTVIGLVDFDKVRLKNEDD